MGDALQEPALDTPPGVVSQFPTLHSEAQNWYYVCATLAAVVPGSLLLLRLYTKLRIVRKVDVTDYLTTSSYLFLIALLICGRKCLAEGAGVHQWNLPTHNYIRVVYWLYIAQIVYAPTIFLAKTAILLQYLHLFAPQKTVNPFMWYSARIIIVVTAIYYIISTMVTTFACSPREAIWDTLITDAKCLDNNTNVLVTCLFNIISDIIILMLPARAVSNLRIPTRNKFRIVLLFAIGLLACIANIMIIVYVNRMGGPSADVAYNTAWQGLWAFAEISFGLTVTGTFLLPKFIEAKGADLRGIFSLIARPFSSSFSATTLTRGTSSSSLGGAGNGNSRFNNFRLHAGNNKDPGVSSRGRRGEGGDTLDTVTMVGEGEEEESDLESANRVPYVSSYGGSHHDDDDSGHDRDVERFPAYGDGVRDTAKYARAHIVDHNNNDRGHGYDGDGSIDSV